MDINNQLMSTFFRFRNFMKYFRSRISADLDGSDVGIAEIALMKAVANNTADSDENANIADIQGHLFVTKGAISQMLGALEKKGYLNREIDKSNRRKLIITLTPSGKELLGKVEHKLDLLLSEIIALIGKDDAMQLISIINRISDVAEKEEK